MLTISPTCLPFSSKRAVDESEMEASERRRLRCVWVTGGRALTEQEAATEIVSEARLLLQEDLAQLGVQWDPTLAPGLLNAKSPDDHHSSESDDTDISRPKKSESTDPNQENIKEENKPEKGMSEKKIENPNGETERGQGRSNPEEPEISTTLNEHKNERTATETGHMCDEAPVGTGKVTKKEDINSKLSTKNDTHKIRERQNHTSSEQEREEESLQMGGNECKRIDSIKPAGQPAKKPIPERSLTQELAEIVSSLPQLLPNPQPSPSPKPPPRFRAPMSRVEERQSASTRKSNGESTTGLASSRALSKVLHSIQSDKNLNNTETVQTCHLAPSPKIITTAESSGPVPRSPTTPPTNHSPLAVSAPSVPSFTPEAKRRRVDKTEIDRFSSPELYAGEIGDEEVGEDVRNGEESFGESFELDTQTERMILQQNDQSSNGNVRGMIQVIGTENIEEEEMVMPVGRNGLEADHNACPTFNLSLTDSQMELILNTSHQVTDQNHQLQYA